MKPLAQLRANVDRLNKTYAKNPMLATGGDGRMTAEAINTGAIARLRGMQQKLPRCQKTLPLAELMKQKG